MELLGCLQSAGYHPTRADEQVFARHAGGQLVRICCRHVDDIKLAGAAAAVQHLKEALESRYDCVEFKQAPFEHTGIMHAPPQPCLFAQWHAAWPHG